MSKEPEILVGKFYTAARKFKQLIGQLPDGTSIPGGPYTFTQFVPALILILLVALKLWIFGAASLWSALAQIIFTLTIATASVFVLGKLPPTRRSIYHLITTHPALIFSSRHGYRNGAAIKNDTDPKPKTLQYLLATTILILFIIKLIVFGTGGFLFFIIQIAAVAGLVIATVTLMSEKDTKTAPKTSTPKASEPIYKVTTTKAGTRPVSGFSRFQTNMK